MLGCQLFYKASNEEPADANLDASCDPTQQPKRGHQRGNRPVHHPHRGLRYTIEFHPRVREAINPATAANGSIIRSLASATIVDCNPIAVSTSATNCATLGNSLHATNGAATATTHNHRTSGLAKRPRIHITATIKTIGANTNPAASLNLPTIHAPTPPPRARNPGDGLHNQSLITRAANASSVTGWVNSRPAADRATAAVAICCISGLTPSSGADTRILCLP
jgi:hypothetical protein